MNKAVALWVMCACGAALAAPSTVPATNSTTAVTQPSGVSVATQPTTRAIAAAVTQPAKVKAAPRPMSKDFVLLLSRSLFVKGRQTVGDSSDSAASTAPAATQEVVRPEKNLIFDGATDSGGVRVALLEDMAAGKVVIARAGDAIATGRVQAITLDALDYRAGDKVTHVLIGQTLDGADGPSPSSRPAVVTTAPTAGSTGDSVLDRLRRRRQQELGK